MLVEFPSDTNVEPALRLFVYLPPGLHSRRKVHIHSSNSDSLPSSVHLSPFTLHHVSKFIVFLSVEIHFWRLPFFLLHWYPVLHQYLSSVSTCTLSPQCTGSPSGTNAFKHICLNLCQGLVGKTKFACPSVSQWEAVYISMPNSPGQLKCHPLGAKP